MRVRVGLILIGLLLASLGAAAARASAVDTTTTATTTPTTDTTTTDTTTDTTTTATTVTTTTDTTTTATTTTAPTTTTTAPSYAPLRRSSLSAGCVGAGVAAVVRPSRPVVLVGAPASSVGPSAYPRAASVLSFGSAAVTGSGCEHRKLTLSSLSLFGGAIKASRVVARDGKGTVAGLEIDGRPVLAKSGQTVLVDGWGELTLGARLGRLSAPLVLRLLRAHGSFKAGTRIAVAFAAAPRPAPIRRAKHTAAKRHAKAKRQTKRKPPHFPVSPDPLLLGDILSPAVQENAVVSIAIRYLGVRYTWGGDRPKTGFDCSGLVKYVFAHLGVALPHFAASQWDSPDAIPVTPKKLRPGDLVFFVGSDGTRKAPGHVGIYVGDGYLIDAPHTGAFVEIDSLSARWFANNYVGARRIVGASRVPTAPLAKAPQLAASSSAADGVGRLLSVPMAFSILPGELASSASPAVRKPAHVEEIWAGSALAGLLLLVYSGHFVLRRRRQPS